MIKVPKQENIPHSFAFHMFHIVPLCSNESLFKITCTVYIYNYCIYIYHMIYNMIYVYANLFNLSFTSNPPYALGTVGVALGAALGGGGGGTPGSANEVCRLNFNLRA